MFFNYTKQKKVLVTSLVPQIIAKIKVLKCLRRKERQCKRKPAGKNNLRNKFEALP